MKFGDYVEVNLENEEELLKVSSTTHCKKVMQTIMTSYKNKNKHRIRGIGAAAINAIVKGCVLVSDVLKSGPVPVEMMLSVNWATVQGKDGTDVSAVEVVPHYFYKTGESE